MAKVKDPKLSKKKMSEGMAIAVIVFVITFCGIVAYYLLSWFFDLLFPGLF